MILNCQSLYAIRAMVFLARQPPQQPISCNDIGAACGISGPFMTKILTILRSHNLVQSSKGPGGGFFLASRPRSISLLEILQAMDQAEDLGRSLHENGDLTITIRKILNRVTQKRNQYLQTIKLSTLAQKESTNAEHPSPRSTH